MTETLLYSGCELTLTVPSVCDVRAVSLAACDVTDASSIYFSLSVCLSVCLCVVKIFPPSRVTVTTTRMPARPADDGILRFSSDERPTDSFPRVRRAAVSRKSCTPRTLVLGVSDCCAAGTRTAVNCTIRRGDLISVVRIHRDLI